MQDFENLEQRGKAYGYACPYCEAWEHSHFMNASLFYKLEEFEKLIPGTNKYRRKLRGFAKSFFRHQKKSEYGTNSNTHKIITR